MDEIEKLHKSHLERIEKLSSRLLKRKYKSAKDLWDIQIDLVNYLIELGEGIKTENLSKKEVNQKIADLVSTKDGDWKSAVGNLQSELKKSDSKIQQLNDAIKLAKKFGDAFAWIFFKGDDKKIRPLSYNKPNPGIPTEISLKAMLSIAENFYRGGAGFPLIHDVTNFLRIGDITFCNIADKNDEPLTVEVKAKTISIEGNTAKLSVSVYADAPQPKFISTVEKINEIAKEMSESQSIQNEGKSEESSEKQNEISDSKMIGYDERFKRQAKRMASARKFQNTKHGDLTKSEDESLPPTLSIGLKLKHSDFHWDILREILKEAKKTGFAFRPVDDALLYCVSYTDEPIIYAFEEAGDFPNSEKLTEAIKQVPLSPDPANNHLAFTTSFEYFSDKIPPHIRPFFWFEIPTDLKMDILWGKIFITVVVNIGKIVEKLKENGIDARLPANDKEFLTQFIPIDTQFTLSNGLTVGMNVFGLKEFGDKIGYEFYSLDGLIDTAKQLIKSSIETIKKQPEFKKTFSKKNIKKLSQTKTSTKSSKKSD